MEIEKLYICTASGNSKKNGSPYAILKSIVKTSHGEFIDDKDFVKLDVLKPVGSKFKYKVVLD